MRECIKGCSGMQYKKLGFYEGCDGLKDARNSGYAMLYISEYR